MHREVARRQNQYVLIGRKSPVRNKLLSLAVVGRFAGISYIRLRAKVVDRGDARNHRRQRCRNLWIDIIGVMLLAVHEVSVDLRVERGAHSAGGTRKLDRCLGSIDSADRESMPLQPARDRSDI